MASSALADPPGDVTKNLEAEALFNEAMELTKAGKYPEACPKLEESQRIDPALGTQYYLAECDEHIGKLASAYSLYKIVADGAQTKEKKEWAIKRAAALEPRLVRVAIDVPESVRQIAGLEVHRASVQLAPAQFEVAVPVDPGKLDIRAQAPGKKRWEVRLEATKEGTTLTVQVPFLEDAPAVAGPASIAAARPAPPPGLTTQHVVGLEWMSFGVVSLGLGIGFAAVAIDKKNASEKDGHCNEAARCDATGFALRSAGRAMGDASTAMFVTAGAAVAAGAVTFFTVPLPKGKPPSTPAVAAYLGLGALGVRGRW